MAFTSRRLLLPQTLPSSPSPSPSTSPSDGISCLTCNPSCHYYPNCPWPYSSPPPPPPSSFPLSPPTDSSHSPGRSPLLSIPSILAISLVSSLFFLSVYFVLLYRSRRDRRNTRGPHLGPPPPSPGDDGLLLEGGDLNQNLAMVHPIWLINTVGIQPAVIDAIAVCQFRKGDGLIEGDYCSICLSDFEEGESLRLLPKCSHAFHIPCIDTWLRSHTNCPLCRAPILAAALNSGSAVALEQAESGSGSGVGEVAGENFEGGDTAGDDMGNSGSVVEGGNSNNVVNDKYDDGGVEVGASVGRRSVSMDGVAGGVVNLNGEGNQRGQIGGVRSLPGSRRFCQ